MMFDQKLGSHSRPPDDPFAELDGLAQAALVNTGEVAALDLVDAAIARIERLNPALNVLVSTGFDMARARAKLVRRDALFAGVPTLIKDLIDYPGLPTGYGSRLLSPHPATIGSSYTEVLDGGGFVTLGKSCTPEFGLLGGTESLATGITRNPWDLSRSPGGSSGGAVAAVAAGLVPVAHASDGGGSIRGPASLCGLFGFKPSRGRCLAAGPETPASWLISDHCVSRSVRDSAGWLSLTERRDASAPLDRVTEPLQRKLRIGVYQATAFGVEPERAVANAFQKACQLCEELGHEMIEVSGPHFNARAASTAFFSLFGAVMAGAFEQFRSVLGKQFDEALAEPFTRALVKRARRGAPDLLAQSLATLNDNARQASNAFEGVDVLMCPTVPFTAYPIGTLHPHADADEAISFTEKLAGYTAIASLTGWPAMTLPAPISEDALPVGCHFQAPLGQDEVLLQFALQLEIAAPWRDRWPSLKCLAS